MPQPSCPIAFRRPAPKRRSDSAAHPRSKDDRCRSPPWWESPAVIPGSRRPLPLRFPHRGRLGPGQNSRPRPSRFRQWHDSPGRAPHRWQMGFCRQTALRQWLDSPWSLKPICGSNMNAKASSIPLKTICLTTLARSIVCTSCRMKGNRPFRVWVSSEINPVP